MAGAAAWSFSPALGGPGPLVALGDTGRAPLPSRGARGWRGPWQALLGTPGSGAATAAMASGDGTGLLPPSLPGCRGAAVANEGYLPLTASQAALAGLSLGGSAFIIR